MRFRDLVPRSSKSPMEKSGGTPLDLFQREFAGFQREMERLYDSFFGNGSSAGARSWQQGGLPSIDESTDDKAYHVQVDLPGMQEKDIDISIADGMLTIRGERTVEDEQKERDFVRKERSWGKFERTVSLPFEVDEDNATASFANGVLSITLPKSATAKSKVKKIALTRH